MKLSSSFAMLLIALGVAGCNDSDVAGSAASPATAAASTVAVRRCQPPDPRPDRAIAALPGGRFRMGAEDVYAEEGPARMVTVSPFAIDRHEVTNARFAAFVEATGYVTVAEKPVDPALFQGVDPADIPAELLKPGSAMFTPPARPSTRYTDWWRYVPGTSWRKPLGPDGPGAVPNEPVVHLAYADMAAFARWAGGRLPSEAEWEYAAGAGAAPTRGQPVEANSWQGVFPMVNQGTDGFQRIAPVGCYRANAFGLHDLIGNVWEMTADYYTPGHDPARPQTDPRGPSENSAYDRDPANPGFASRVIKGGSYLCAPNYCQRYRAAARSGRDPGLGASNVGFRLAYDRAPPA